MGGELNICVVEECPNETDGAQLCASCVDRLAVRLREVPGLVDELEVTVTKQDKLGARGGGGGRSNEPPLPFNASASDARAALRDILGSWCRDVAERSGERLPAAVRRDATSDAAAWLLGHLRAAAHHPAAGDLYDEVTGAIWAAVQAIDRPPDRVFAGWCCVALYAAPGRRTTTCRECETVHEVDTLRAALLDRLEDLEGTATGVSRMLEAAGVRVTPARIWQWASRGKLTQRPGRRYRVGDVVAVAAGREAA